MTDTAPPAGTGEETRIQAYDDRFKSIEGEQKRQGGVLDTILGKLGDGGGKDAGKPDPGKEGKEGKEDPGTGGIADQVAAAVRAVRAEERAAEDKKKHDADHAAMRKPPAEKAPREGEGWKTRMQRAVFGGDPS